MDSMAQSRIQTECDSRTLGGWLVFGLIIIGTGFPGFGYGDEAKSSDGIQLIIREDDMGSCHTANIACVRCFREGIAKSVEVMVPTPWFNEAVKLLQENPGLDVGVHLTLTSEWDNIKWGPITKGLSLMDREGHFFPTTRGRDANRPGFLDGNPQIAEVEKELRAQIELALQKISHVTHLSSHMGTPNSTPELKELIKNLSQEYKLPFEAPEIKYFPHWGANLNTANEREKFFVDALENLTPGVWLFVEHPGMDTPEMQAIGHPGYENVAADRDGVTRVFTSDKVKQVIQKRGIQLISYGEYYRRNGS